MAALAFLLLVSCCFTQLVFYAEQGGSSDLEVSDHLRQKSQEAEPGEEGDVILLSITKICAFENPLEGGGEQEEEKWHVT